MAIDLSAFKEALAVALANSPPMRKYLVKKKLKKGKMGLVQLEAFIQEWAPEEYRNLFEGNNGGSDDKGRE